MKKNQITQAMVSEATENRILILDYRQRIAWDVTNYYDYLVAADDRVKPGTDLIAAINNRALLTSFSATQLWAQCPNKDQADTDLEEINWNLKLLINQEANPDKKLFEYIEAASLAEVG